MKWTEKHIAGIVSDLAEEDLFACQALFRIARVEFTKRVPTLAVSLSDAPVLYINREFLEKHALSENDVQAVLMHEFLHVVLQHTEQFEQVDPFLNIALDSIINSIIHRSYGERFSDFFKRFYEPEGLTILLRPCDPEDFIQNPQWKRLHQSIYSGTIAANDLYDLIRHLTTFHLYFLKGNPEVIGNHGAIPSKKSEKNRKLLDGILGKMNGTRIWNNIQTPGVSDLEELETRRMKLRKLQEWKRDTRRLLEKCLLPDRSRREEGLQAVPMPFLSSGDRRAFAQLRGSHFLPFSEHGMVRSQPRDTVTVYLDVSGSMRNEIDYLLLLLSDLLPYIRTPLWVFSNKVEPAVFRNGSVEYKSTGGTSISCVFDHIREHGFRRSLIVTDGYVEAFTDTNLNGISKDGLRVLISATGQPAIFDRHGICYHQLPFLKK